MYCWKAPPNPIAGIQLETIEKTIGTIFLNTSRKKNTNKI